MFVVGRAGEGFQRVFEDCTYSMLVTTRTLVSCRFWFQFNPRAPELPARSLLAAVTSLRDTDYLVNACLELILMTVILLALSCKCAFSGANHEASGFCN